MPSLDVLSLRAKVKFFRMLHRLYCLFHTENKEELLFTLLMLERSGDSQLSLCKFDRT